MRRLNDIAERLRRSGVTQGDESRVAGILRTFSTWPLIKQLSLLTIAATLPLLAASAVMFSQLVANERAAIRQNLAVNARTLAALIENEIDRHIAIASTLALSSALETDDLPRFWREAARAIEHVPGSWLSLSTPDGQVVLSTLAPMGTTWPKHSAPDTIARGFATRQPQVGDLIFGSVSKRWTTFLEMPVFRNEKPQYSISMSIPPARFLALLEKQFTRGEVVAIIDRKKVIIARVPEHDTRIGMKASEGWQAAIAKAPDGWTDSQNLDGNWSITGYAQTAHGWTAGIGQLDVDLAKPLRKVVWWSALTAIALTLMSLAMAGLIARHAGRGIGALAQEARRIGRGEAPAALSTPFAEAKTIADALHEASNEIEQRGILLAQANSDLEAKVLQRTEELRTEMRRREETEATLRQAYKLESIGQLTGGIAHDFNNMLTIIMGNLDTVQRRLKTLEHSAVLNRPVDAAMAGARNAAKLTHRLLAFSRQQPLEPTSVNLNSLVSGLADMVTRSVGETIKVETVLAAGLWHALVDAGQIESAIVNLAVNAKDAMPSGGKLTIEAANTFLDERYSARFGDLKPGQYVMLSVSDTGTGIPPDKLEKVFEPFSTTKDPGLGTGLGLAMVHGFVKQSGGHVRIYSELGEGTAVKIYLPRLMEVKDLPAAPRENGAAVQPIPRANTGEIILVVEDDPGVSSYCVDALEDLGYQVLAAESGDQALRILGATARIDLLFTDVVLGGRLNGRQLAEIIAKNNPLIPVLFTSGYTRNAIVHEGRVDAGVHLLNKPYTQRDLAEKVRILLDESRSQVNRIAIQ